MPHFNVKKPRFYPLRNLEIDTRYDLAGEITKTINGSEIPIDSGLANSLANFNPYKSKTIATTDSDGAVTQISIRYASGQYLDTSAVDGNTMNLGMNFFGICGHTLAKANAMIRILALQKVDNGDGTISYDTEPVGMTPIFNCSKILDSSENDDWIIGTHNQTEVGYSVTDEPALDGEMRDGSLMFEVDSSDISATHSRFFQIEIKPLGGGALETFSDDIDIGSFVWGRYYDMPHSPDLTYSMDIKYDGIKSKKTVGGSTISNLSYSGNPGFLGKFDGFSRKYRSGAMVGRKSWKLNFSSLASEYDTNLNQEKGVLFPRTHLSESEWRYGNNFLNRVLEVTLGGQMAFIWEFDTSVLEENTGEPFWAAGEHNEAHFIVGRFTKDSISFKHTSHKVFNVSMQIEEVW